MSLNRLFEQLESHSHAPTEQWDPPYCGEIPLTIKANGDWFYQGSKINRPRLVKLFASVLVREQDDYFLITPAEKVKITVEDAPFMVIDWQHLSLDGQPVIQVVTNIDERYILSEQTPLRLINEIPYVCLLRGLTAKVHRNVFYQWVELATEEAADEGREFVIQSADQVFSIGQVK